MKTDSKLKLRLAKLLAAVCAGSVTDAQRAEMDELAQKLMGKREWWIVHGLQCAITA